MPYNVEKVNMNCYGKKPDWFWQMQPSGGIPVARLDGSVIRESNDIMVRQAVSIPGPLGYVLPLCYPPC